MLARSQMLLLGSHALPNWLGEILMSAGVAARTLAVFAAAIAAGDFRCPGCKQDR